MERSEVAGVEVAGVEVAGVEVAGVEVAGAGGLRVVPVTFAVARAFVKALHRHNANVTGMKFCVGVADGAGGLRGVAVAGRPVARALDDGLTLEVTRTCTDGARNGNSLLYGACRRAAWALGYRRVVTYTQGAESGASLRAAGFTVAAQLPARGSWAQHSRALRGKRHPVGTGGVARVRWQIVRADPIITRP